MEFIQPLNLSIIPLETHKAAKHVMDNLLHNIHPLTTKIRNKLQPSDTKVQEFFSLSCNQIQKCILHFLNIFKFEYKEGVHLQESRLFTIDRLMWCVNRLLLLEEKLYNSTDNSTLNDGNDSDNSIMSTPMYFINWIDHTFDVLSKLSEHVASFKTLEDGNLYELWKCDVVNCVSDLHTSVDELLLSAMTLCKYCLSTDQHIVKARCQVVLRETNTLLNELFAINNCDAVRATTDSLKLPIMPTNVNLVINVLKDVLYVLETNTNTALLALLIHCFSGNRTPVDQLIDHFNDAVDNKCPCGLIAEGDSSECCAFVKEFDLYNERLLQIGSFAVSCSSDQTRVVSVRSALASLEALEAHLVPAVMMTGGAPRGPAVGGTGDPMTAVGAVHASLLAGWWRESLREIRDNVFLIVDPAAFAEKSKQIMHQKLLEVLKEEEYNNSKVCFIINIGCLVYDFFTVYNSHEPDALGEKFSLLQLLADLNKVQLECKVVSDILCSENDYVYGVKQTKKAADLAQLLKRLKLLYTLVTRIDRLLQPKDDEEKLFGDLTEVVPVLNNLTHTVCKGVNETYINSPKKQNNLTRSVFARTSHSTNRNYPLTKLLKHLKTKKSECLSFSVQLDNFDFNENSEAKKENKESSETPVPYGFTPRKSVKCMRKRVLERNLDKNKLNTAESGESEGVVTRKESFLDDNTSLQITEILDQMTNITSTFCSQAIDDNIAKKCKQDKNILTLNINSGDVTISKRLWNIPVNASTVEASLEDSSPDFNTLERMRDLNMLENKLSNLKSMQETIL